MGGSKNKSPAQKEKSQKKESGKKDKKKLDKESKTEIVQTINENDAIKIIQNSNGITAYELAKQTNVKISTANSFLKKSLENNLIKQFGGFSGHYVYQKLSE